jgi:hypothetical protein
MNSRLTVTALGSNKCGAQFAAVRPPLMKLSVKQREQLVASLQLFGFSMPGL